MYHGSYEWYFDNEDLEKAKSMTAGQSMSSGLFEMSQLKWILYAYPNGVNTDGQGWFDLYLQIRKMPYKWSMIVAFVMLKCKETHAQQAKLLSFNKNGRIIS